MSDDRDPGRSGESDPAPDPPVDRDASDSPERQPETRAARAGHGFDLPGGSPGSVPPVLSSGFEQPNAATVDAIFAGEREGHVYGRYHNPTVEALEAAVADLEGAEACAAYASGMAAIAGAFDAIDLAVGATVLAAESLYGTTITWIEDAAARNGWDLRRAPLHDAADATIAIEAARPRVVYCETLSNPLVRPVDLDEVGDACDDLGAALVVDATFTPPTLLRPIEHGATLVVHSATKYLGGHGDLLAGVLSGPAGAIGRARSRRKLEGTIVDPFTAWLVLRGMRTLAVRVERQCDNARRVAEHLADHPAVARVEYPGARSPTPEGWQEHATLERLFPHGRHGAMLAFELAAGTAESAARFLDALELWRRVTTLGDLNSLVSIPAMTSHRPQSPEVREAMGIGDALVRLSVGIEAADDLIADLDRALEAAR